MLKNAAEENMSSFSISKNKPACILAAVLAATALTALTFMVALIVILTKHEKSNEVQRLPEWPSPSASPMGVFRSAAIAADNGVCSEIGRDIMIRGGNAVDAAVAAAFCVGLMNPHSTGIGGGHFMTIYNRTTKSCLILDARETAPASAYKDMYANISVDVAARGWRSIAIPGEVYGLRKAYELAGSGRVEWRDLLQPTINLCRNGYAVSVALADTIKQKTDMLRNETTMKDLFYNHQKNRMYKAGDIMRRPLLAETLEALANSADPIKMFYEGELTKKFLKEFQENDANITMEDFARYTAKERTALVGTVEGTNVVACGPPPPSSAAIVISIIKIMSQYNITPAFLNDSVGNNVETYHRFVEAMKYAYAAREHLGDMDFVPDALELAKTFISDWFAKEAKLRISAKAHKNESYYYFVNEPTYAAADDHGTSHVSVLDADGNAVSLTGTINLFFGSIRRSISTDIIWNDDMDDFSTPGTDNSFGYAPSPSNYIEPGKRPLSSMTPIIIYDNVTGEAKIVAGAAGGSRIISATASVVTRLLWFGENVKEATDRPRLHNQLHPFCTSYENGFPTVYVDELAAKSQNMTISKDNAVACTVVRSHGLIYANSDYRKSGGYAAGY